MVYGNFRRKSGPARGVMLALAAGLSLVLASSQAVHAGSGEPAYQFNKNKASDASPANNNWAHSTGAGGKATTLTQIVNDGSVAPFLVPDSASLLQAAASRYEQIVASGGWPAVPGGKLRQGAGGKGVAALNQRLFIEGYLRKEATEGEFSEIYTSATADAVMRFQRNMGLFVSGAVDGPTLKELNVPAQRRLAAIRSNIPRITEYQKDLGSRYVVVNVPAAQIEAVGDGRVYSIHNAIVGRESRPTPVVTTALATVRFNPYWNAPASIIEKDIIPRMLSSGSSKIMRDMNMKIFQGVGGPEVNPDKVNWRRAVPDNYHFRQEPGGANAMATAKIEFNSPFGIYLHDTPEPQLFDTGQRFYSSGCVRVEKVAILLNWILQGQDGIDSARVTNLAETKERLDVEIKNPPQLRVVYLTAWPAKDGMVGFRPDVYELDNSGFIVGQPLPVGERIAGQRYVLKPVPRLVQSVDADNETGFFAFFGASRNPEKQSGFVSPSKTSDALAGKSKSRTAVKAGSKLKPGTRLAARPFLGRKAAESETLSGATQQADAKPAKKKLSKTETAKKKSLASATTGSKKTTAKAAKADVKLPAGKTVVAEKKADPAKAKVADKCKDSKADACKVKPVVAKKPAVKPEKTASAAN